MRKNRSSGFTPHLWRDTLAPVLVSFIIPLYNCLPLTQAMLASLQATLPAGLAHEIIFVDDGSTDGTREWLAALRDPLFRVLLNERNLGYATGNNRGAAAARGQFLALLNNDLVLQPRWLEPMLAAHRSLGAQAGLIGNVQLDARSGAVDHAGLVINRTGKPVHVRATPSSFTRLLAPVRRVPAVTGACLFVERALWETLGGFDEGYVNGGEDIDLCFRARAAGRVNAVALGSVVRHHVSASPGRKARDEENSFRLARRWRAELIAAADDGARTWCREYLAQALAQPRSREYRLALAACAFLAHLRPSPPREAVAAVAAGLDREFARWSEMFAPDFRSAKI
ncbi:MAG: glycosyltransferase family 2 protein [Opitutus sp.]|nr:glycosyltransferase family 2 protein [Opitutus sp.]